MVPSRNQKGNTMKVSTAFPSNYIKANDLDGEPWLLTIRTCKSEVLGQGNDKKSKLVVHFDEAQKGLILNKTNSNVIAGAYGDETDDWEGEPVEIYPTEVEFKGNRVDGIRIRIPPKAQPKKQQDAAGVDEDFDDEIPDF